MNTNRSNESNPFIVDSFANWICIKKQFEMENKLCPKKTINIKGLPNLQDAKKAGTIYSLECMLIITEGVSAKNLVNDGFSVGLDKFGIFSLRGTMLNVRDASDSQIMENDEIKNLATILGLKYDLKYTIDEIKSLRYGKVIIATDSDLDGSHIAGLILNFFHFLWPSLIKLEYIERIITPIIKVTNGSFKRSFYSLPEFEEWKHQTPNDESYNIKYFKGIFFN